LPDWAKTAYWAILGSRWRPKICHFRFATFWATFLKVWRLLSAICNGILLETLLVLMLKRHIDSNDSKFEIHCAISGNFSRVLGAMTSEKSGNSAHSMDEHTVCIQN